MQRKSRAVHVTAKAMSGRPWSGVRLSGLAGVGEMARDQGLVWRQERPVCGRAGRGSISWAVTCMPACLHVGSAVGTEAGRPLLPAPLALAAVDETGAGQVQGPHRSSPGRDEVGGRHRRPAPVPSGWGNYFRTGNAADKFIELDRYVAWRLKRLLIKKQGPQPTRRTGGALDPDLVP